MPKNEVFWNIIAGLWTWTLNSEMLDPGPIFWPKTHKIVRKKFTMDLYLVKKCTKSSVFWAKICQGSSVSEFKVQAQGAKCPKNEWCPVLAYTCTLYCKGKAHVTCRGAKYYISSVRT